MISSEEEFKDIKINPSSSLKTREVYFKETNCSCSLRNSKLLDMTGIGLSFGCLIHCLFGPFIITLLSSFTLFELISIKSSELYIHLFLLLFIGPICLFTFYNGYKQHRSLIPLTLSVIGILSLTFGIEELNLLSGTFHLFLNLLGSLLIILAHLINLFKSYRTRC
jgi:MerC mercury resistance protein